MQREPHYYENVDYRPTSTCFARREQKEVSDEGTRGIEMGNNAPQCEEVGGLTYAHPNSISGLAGPADLRSPMGQRDGPPRCRNTTPQGEREGGDSG